MLGLMGSYARCVHAFEVFFLKLSFESRLYLFPRPPHAKTTDARTDPGKFLFRIAIRDPTPRRDSR